jgi:hypothetical protein
VYFTHEGHAGLSAFARGDAGAEERNAKFVSVGVLVRKDGGYGRLGRSWVVAGKLEALAKELAGDESVEPLEEFWGEVRRTETQEQNKGEGKSRARAISTGSVKKEEEEKLHGYHPAKSIWGYIDMLGPLVFRLQQAALLRKRILFVGGAPVRGMCEFGKFYLNLMHTTTHLANRVDSLHLIYPLQPLLKRLRTPPSRYREFITLADAV